MPRPPTGIETQVIGVRLPREEAAAVRMAAARELRPVSHYVRRLLREAVVQDRRAAAPPRP